MQTLRIAEYKFWSPMLGDDAVRISLYDARGQEYYAIRTYPGEGKSLRELREATALRIFDAMESGAQPGEVA